MRAGGASGGRLLHNLLLFGRVLRGLGLAVSLAWNAVWIVRLARDFGAMAPTPLW